MFELHVTFSTCKFLPLFLLYMLLEQVVSPFPPSDKLGITSVQRESEEIVPMKQMKMDWVPYIPLENRYYQSSISSFICILLQTYFFLVVVFYFIIL